MDGEDDKREEAGEISWTAWLSLTRHQKTGAIALLPAITPHCLTRAHPLPSFHSASLLCTEAPSLSLSLSVLSAPRFSCHPYRTNPRSATTTAPRRHEDGERGAAEGRAVGRKEGRKKRCGRERGRRERERKGKRAKMRGTERERGTGEAIRTRHYNVEEKFQQK